MNKKLNLKNKKTLVIIVIVLFLILAISFSTILYKGRNVNKLQGDVTDFKDKLEESSKGVADDLKDLAESLRTESSSSVEGIKTVEDICSDSQVDGILVVKGTIIENIGDEGTAKVTLTSGDKVYTENLTINSNKVTRFAYSLPQGIYNMKIEKDGFITYESVIQEDEQLKIILKNKENPDLYESNYLYANLYYTYTDSGVLTLYSKGEYDTNLLDSDNPLENISDVSKVTILGNIAERQFEKNGITMNINGGLEGFIRILLNIQYGATIGTGIDYTGENRTLRETMELYRTQIETGICTDENYTTSPCSNESGQIISTYGSTANALTALDILLKIPVNSDTIIADGISYVGPYLLGFTTTDTITIPSSVEKVGQAALIGGVYNTLNYNTTQSIPNDFASNGNISNININANITSIGNSAFECGEELICKINKINLPDSITSIGSYAFKNVGLGSITLPTSLTSIGNSAFENNNLENLVIPASVTKIDDDAFAGNKLKTVSIVNTSDNKSKLTEIGESAFACSDSDNTKCNSIIAVTLPESLTNIDYNAFKNNKLESIIIPANVTSIYTGAFTGNPFTNIIIQGTATRFNRNWTDIGFPVELKPTN